MKKLWKKIALGLVALTMASQAHALILIEPYVGYDFSLSGDSNGESVDFSGLGYGGRLGLQLTSLMFGVSYDLLSLDLDYGGSKTNFDQTNFGVFFGWSPKAEGIRFWGTYFINAKGDNARTDQDDKGNGWALALGYKFKPWLALNLEYRSYSFDKPTGVDLGLDSLFLTVSFPFDIL